MLFLKHIYSIYLYRLYLHLSTYILLFWDRVSIYSLGCPTIYLYLKQEIADCQFIFLEQIICPLIGYSSYLRTNINWANYLPQLSYSSCLRTSINWANILPQLRCSSYFRTSINWTKSLWDWIPKSVFIIIIDYFLDSCNIAVINETSIYSTVKPEK